MKASVAGDNNMSDVKKQIIQALSHPEAQDGLYFRNFSHLHEEDERMAVEARDEEILDALQQLIKEGRVNMDNGEGEAIFSLI
jgi:hypothetical protein